LTADDRAKASVAAATGSMPLSSDAAASDIFNLSVTLCTPSNTNVHHHHCHRGGMVQKTPPPIELQCNGTVTTLIARTVKQFMKLKYKSNKHVHIHQIFSACILWL